MGESVGPSAELTPLKRALVAVRDLTARLERAERSRREPIAIVGIGCRFPGGANDPQRYWELLRDGRSGIREVPADRWSIDGLYDPDPDAAGKMYTRFGGFLDTPVDRFDATFFGITPREAAGMDPQQRLLLELAWEAIEDSGYAADQMNGSRTGVYVGISARDYSILHGRGDASGLIDAYSATGGAFSVAAGRISYLLGLQGPNLALDTACSSSLVAVALAVQSLRDGHCDQALAGGVNLLLTPETSIAMCRLHALSPDGRCKTFDAAADGYGRGEGGGVVMLKRLSDALEAGDHIRAVIRGVAINHDGRSSGLTVPNAAAQQEVIRSALEDAGAAPAQIDFVEAHGTGTPLGDPIELRSMAAVLGEGRSKQTPVAVGAVKTNIGHLEAAAGIAGLIKLVLGLEHGKIPPHLHLQNATQHVDWDELPLVVPTALTPWPKREHRPLAGVSSFGFSGTNAHVILEAAPQTAEAEHPAERPFHVLALSAKTPAALRQIAMRFRDHLSLTSDRLIDICQTAGSGRMHFEHRLAVVGSTHQELHAALDKCALGETASSVAVGRARSSAPSIAFLFSGQGAQAVGLGRELYESEPAFRAAFDECAELLKEEIGQSDAQTAGFALDYALAQLWRSWGVEPAAVLGHSVGEYAAAVIAGALDVKDAVKLVAARSRLMHALPDAMLDEFERVAASVQFRPARIPVISGMMGRVLNADEISDPAYWGRQLRGAVQFASGIEHLRADGHSVFVEIGAHPTLLASAQAGMEAADELWLPSLRRGVSDALQMRQSLAALYVAGIQPNWRGLDPDAAARRVSLPSYPFQGERHWLEHSAAELSSPNEAEPQPSADANEWLYEVEWRKTSRPLGSERPTDGPGHWVIIADRAGKAEALAGSLRARGETCIIAPIHPHQKMHASAASPHGESAGELKGLLLAAAAGERPLRGVIDISGTDAREPETFQHVGSPVALQLVQAVAELRSRQRGCQPRVWLLTCGAQPFELPAGCDAALAQTPLWGFGKSVGLEHPALWGGVIDLDPSCSESQMDQIAAELVAPSGENEIVLRGDERFVSRIVAADVSLESLPRFRPRVDGAYLITGGLGALGLQVARWLAGQGARRLILLSRTQLPPRTEWNSVRDEALAARIEQLREIELLGASIHTAAVDVADEAALASFLTAYAAEAFPPIRGIVHAAGVLRDRTVLQLDAAAVEEVLMAKARGAWLLHRLTAETPLDCFILFSSAASLLGSAGQANYAAANAFLDGLALERRRHGLAALSINWGAWAGAGLAARRDLEQRRERAGVPSISPGEGIAILARLATVSGRVGVIPLPPPRLRELFEEGVPALAALAAVESKRAAPQDEQSLRDVLNTLEPGRRSDALCAHIQHIVARITGSKAQDIPLEKSVMELGMDSLMVVELLRHLNRDLGLALYPREIFERGSLTDLGEYLLAEMYGTGVARDVSAPLPRLSVQPIAVPGRKNPPAVFLLSSPRSGSTLLRIMLAGHRDLFCPPELHLLAFDGMSSRQAALKGSYLDEGLQRALMELHGIDAQQSLAMLGDWITQDLPIASVYALIQERAAPRILVDKTPSYTADIAVLERAEQIFTGAKYIHLVRHPYAVIESFTRNRLDRIVDKPGANPFIIAEQVWTESNRNTLDFLTEVDAERQHRVVYEDLVTDPATVMRRLSEFLEVPFSPELLDPYSGKRMADGVHATSLPIGDANFEKHNAIDSALAYAWRDVQLPQPLNGITRRIAGKLGYAVGDSAEPTEVPHDVVALPPIRAATSRGPQPLSFAQQRLWFLDRLEPNSATYNLPLTVHLKGQLNVPALEAALRSVVQRHEVLRANLLENDGIPIQVVADLESFTLPLDDLTVLPEAERRARMIGITSAEVRQPFDLTRDVKLRARLVRLAPDEHTLIITMHHIASDGSSLRILLRELSQQYDGFVNAGSAVLAPLPIQYADYAAWQQQCDSEGRLRDQLDYWKRQLAHLPTLELPTDRPRLAQPSHRGGFETRFLSDAVTKALATLSREQNATLFMTLVAAFKILLSRLSRQDDVVIGTPIAGRHYAGTDNLIGFFLNNLVLRTDVSGDPTFRELIERVRATTLDAYAYQDVPFERLIDELKPRREISRSPLFQVLFNMVPAMAATDLRFGEATAVVEAGNETETKFDLTLYAVPGERLQLRLVYAADLFDNERMRAMLGSFEVLLEAAATHPERRISTLPIMRSEHTVQPDAARAAKAPRTSSDPATIPAAFAAQAARTPHAIAVETTRYSWTYAELDSRASAIAQLLFEKCGAGDARVALCFEHDAPMVAGLLGVLKAGKTYVPLEPRTPEKRLRRILEDCEPAVVLTESANLESIRLAAGAIRICTTDATPARSVTDMALPADDAASAYILYTSGSTGEPKGVVQSHRNVLHHIGVYSSRLGIGANDRLSLFSTYGFDAAVMDIFAALLNGATLCPVDLRTTAGFDLPKALSDRGITVYHSTPTVYRHFTSQIRSRVDVATIRCVVLGGESVAARDFEAFKNWFSPAAAFINGYGPTECTVALQQRMDHGSSVPDRFVPIGDAVEGTEVLLLNEAGEEVAVLAAGEIVIRSAHVACGYWRRPELTERAFAPDPQGGDRRLYRTGDLGRRLPNGAIEFAGRKDTALKIRGYRVEPAEIEAALCEHRGVEQAVVLGVSQIVAPADAVAETELIAYVVRNANVRPDELRDLLRSAVPDYMIPSAFVFLNRIPLTANGKIDRAALLTHSATATAVEEPGRGDQAARREPTTRNEQLIAAIWRDLLGVSNVSVQDNFYDLGGHSLKCAQFVSRLEKASGTRVDIREVAYQTLGQLAKSCEANGASAGREDSLLAKLRGSLLRLTRLPPLRSSRDTTATVDQV